MDASFFKVVAFFVVRFRPICFPPMQLVLLGLLVRTLLAVVRPAADAVLPPDRQPPPVGARVLQLALLPNVRSTEQRK